jgi:hypothetical protein
MPWPKFRGTETLRARNAPVFCARHLGHRQGAGEDARCNCSAADSLDRVCLCLDSEYPVYLKQTGRLGAGPERLEARGAIH